MHLRGTLGLLALHFFQGRIKRGFLLRLQTQRGGQILQIFAHPRAASAITAAGCRTVWLHVRQRRAISRLETQGSIAHLEHTIALADFNLCIDGQPRQQGAIAIVHADHHRIGHHVIGGGRRHPHLLDHAGKLPIREGIGGKTHRLAFSDLADVGFIHRQFNLHLGKIFGNGEQHRRGEAGGHGLARVDGAGQHHAIHWRANHRTSDIDLGGLQRCRLLPDQRLRRVHLRLRLITASA